MRLSDKRTFLKKEGKVIIMLKGDHEGGLALDINKEVR